MLFKDRDKESAGFYDEQYVYFYCDGQIRGQFSINSQRYVWNLEIYEQFRNQGYGNLMIKEMVERFSSDICRPLNLRVLNDNYKARHLYEKYGFQYLTSNDNYATAMIFIKTNTA
jgi:ribosomal-protein-alanine N-acetyltransferase